MADRSVNVKLKMDVAAYLAGARAASAATRDVDKAARDLRKALNEEEDAAGRVRVAEERLNEVRASGKASASQLAAAEEDLARAHRQHEIAADRVSAANERYIESQKKAANEAKKSADKIDTEMSRMAARTNAQFDALKFTAFSVGLPAAAAVGAVGVTAALGLMTGGFAALGVAGVKDSKQIQDAVTSLKTRVVDDVKAMSLPLQHDVIGALDDAGAAWQRLAPQVTNAVQASAPAVRELTGAATDLAEGAMPGVVKSVGDSLPVLKGVRDFAGSAGTGLGEFAANASQGSAAAGQAMTILGGTVRTLESRMGTLFANVANGSAGPLRSLDAIVDQLTGGLVDLTAEGSGALGLLQGFSTSGTGAVTALRGVLSVVSALPPELTQTAGSFTAVQMIASKFGVDAGAGFEGLNEKIKKAEGTSGKFKAAIGGLAAGALNPAFIGVSALTLGLDMLGEAQERAAQKAAEHAENVRGLLQAYRQDGGVVGVATKEYNANALASKNAEANLGSFGASMGLAKNAILGNVGAYKQLSTAANSRIAQIGQEAGLSAGQIASLQKLSQGLLDNGGAYSDVKDKVERLAGTQINAGRAGTISTNQLTDAQKSLLEQIYNGTGAVGEQIRAQRDAQNAYYMSESALTGLGEAQIKARDATSEHTQAIYEQVNAQLGYRGAALNVQQALENYNKTLKDGKSTALERSQAEFQLEQAMQQQIVAAGKAAAAAADGASDKQKEAIATAAMNAETVKLANTFSGPLPASLQQTIGKLDATSATAAGLKLGVNKLGEAVYFLPNGKYIKIESSADQEKARIQSLIDRINAIPTNKKSTVEIVTIYRQVGTAATRTGINSPDVYLYGPHSAAGGLVAKSPIRKFQGGGMVDIRGGGLLRGPGSGTSDSIMGWSSRGPAAFSDTEFVVNAKDTKRALPLLEFINGGGLRGYSGGGLVDAAREALGQANSGRGLYEDFSYSGNSANLSRYNDELAALYYARPGATADSGAMAAWLSSFVSGQSAMQQAIASGTAVHQVPNYNYGGRSLGALGTGDIQVQVFVGDREITDIVDTRIRYSNRQTRRSVTTGAGGAR